jgi:hypothetical protein
VLQERPTLAEVPPSTQRRIGAGAGLGLTAFVAAAIVAVVVSVVLAALVITLSGLLG